MARPQKNVRADSGRPKGMKAPCTGTSTMSDGEFWRSVWAQVPTAVERAERGTGARSGQ